MKTKVILSQYCIWAMALFSETKLDNVSAHLQQMCIFGMFIREDVAADVVGQRNN